MDFQRVETGGVEGVREQHLALLPRCEGNLLRAALAAVRVEEDTKVRPRALAEVAERGADLERLVDAERELGQVERLDGDVVARLGADVQERDARRDGQALQRLQRPPARRCLAVAEAGFLKIAEDDEFLQPVLHLRGDVGGEFEGLGEVRRAEVGFELSERLRDTNGVERRRFEQLARRAAHEDDGDIGAGAGLLDELRSGFLGLREVRGRARAGGHRVGVVEQDDERGLRAAEQRAHPGENGPRHAEREQHGDEAAHEEQEELLELEPPRVRLKRGVEQVHRAPLHDAWARAVEEVQQDRNRRRRHAAEEEEV